MGKKWKAAEVREAVFEQAVFSKLLGFETTLAARHRRFFDSGALRLFKANLHQFPLKRVEIVHQRNALVEAERARRLSLKLIDAFLKVCPKQQTVRR